MRAVPAPTLGFSTKRSTLPSPSITTTPYLEGSSTCGHGKQGEGRSGVVGRRRPRWSGRGPVCGRALVGFGPPQATLAQQAKAQHPAAGRAAAAPALPRSVELAIASRLAAEVLRFLPFSGRAGLPASAALPFSSGFATTCSVACCAKGPWHVNAAGGHGASLGERHTACRALCPHAMCCLHWVLWASRGGRHAGRPALGRGNARMLDCGCRAPVGAVGMHAGVPCGMHNSCNILPNPCYPPPPGIPLPPPQHPTNAPW